MARSDTRFREAHNALLDYCAELAVGDGLPTETELGAVADVSRTVVRRCLGRLAERGVIAWDGRAKRLLRPPRASDRIAVPAPTGGVDLETHFLDWVLRFDVPAGTPISVADLSRRFGVLAHEMNEFLASLSRFGLVARRRQGGWVMLGFTRDFAVELSEFRTVLEMNAVARVCEAPTDHPVWGRLARVRVEHLALRDRIETDFHEFSKLDQTFHEAVNAVVRNRFAAEFQKIVSLIFHYHYMWDKTHERARNEAAIEEHLAVIDALEARDADAAAEAARNHLRTSRTTLLASLRDNALG